MLALGGVPFEIVAANINEDSLPDEEPKAYVARLAREKAQAAAKKLAGREAIVVAADSTVVLDGRILGKPADATEARAILRSLRGQSHVAYTAISVLRTGDGVHVNDLAETPVPMRNYTDEEIDTYIATGDPLDKAGAYAIQHPGFRPAASMTGCRANVVGLPLCHLMRTLAKWDLTFEADVPSACQAHLNYDCPVSGDILAWRQ